VETRLLTAGSDVVTVDELPAQGPTLPGLPQSLTSLENAEREAILAALRQADGNIAGAARLLEISRSTLYRKMDRFSINPS
jgi:transcriptional regulator of acetoin/glycerol metabolism